MASCKYIDKEQHIVFFSANIQFVDSNVIKVYGWAGKDCGLTVASYTTSLLNKIMIFL